MTPCSSGSAKSGAGSPAAGTIEACDFRDLDEQLVAAGATVWGISPDGAASHVRFRAKFGLTFPLR